MKRCTLAGATIAACLLSCAPAWTQDGASAATMFRLFLKDGTALVSYGEYAVVENRVIFSMPIGASESNPTLHLVNIASDNVDWDKTTRYAESARAAHY